MQILRRTHTHKRPCIMLFRSSRYSPQNGPGPFWQSTGTGLWVPPQWTKGTSLAARCRISPPRDREQLQPDDVHVGGEDHHRRSRGDRAARRHPARAGGQSRGQAERSCVVAISYSVLTHCVCALILRGARNSLRSSAGAHARHLRQPHREGGPPREARRTGGSHWGNRCLAHWTRHGTARTELILDDHGGKHAQILFIFHPFLRNVVSKGMQI